ncbi:laminin G domain protein [Teladorsagia circumcincta]|uniref:Laminin G domain protein n=1 Tax=Teladorsagia circumcincta TaxID=45464 RepID=A0A2G9TXV0_TELCI|nr:laminin G domain protein [Teladorsagia circumcincta]
MDNFCVLKHTRTGIKRIAHAMELTISELFPFMVRLAAFIDPNVAMLAQPAQGARLGDNANDFGSRRVVNTIRIEEVRVDDDRWHSLALFQSWENVKMELDASLVFKILNQRSFIFGNILKNSDVFVGGVPQLTLVVDGRKDEIRQYAPELDWIGHSFAYLGSVPLERHVTGVTKNAFRGCVKQVKYDADAQRILFVTLADQGFGGSIIKTAFHFRTTEKDGLLLYHGNTGKDITDYVAFELIDGHLHMIINLGSGAVRLQSTARHVNDGDTWHSLHLERVGRTGSVIVDSMKTDFNTPGVSSNLIVEPTVIDLTGERLLHILPYTLESEAETIEIRFKTDTSRGVLLSTKSNSDPKNQLIVYLNVSSLGVLLRHESGENVFNWGSGISDNRWHFMRLKRRGEKVLLYFDGKWQQNNYLPTLIVLKIDEISSGVGFRKGSGTLAEPFRGAVSRMMFNGIDLLERAKREGKLNKESKGLRNM